MNRTQIIAAHREGTCESAPEGGHCHCSNLLGNRPCLICPAPVTLPGEKDSMEAYAQDRAPEMAPFVFLPRSERVVGYNALFRLPYMANLYAVTYVRTVEAA